MIRKRSAGEWTIRGLAAVGAGALVLGATTALVDFFGSALPYTIRDKPRDPLDSDEFLQYLSVVTDGTMRRSQLTRLRNGEEFYPAELDAIRSARQSINLEYYEFGEDRVGGEMLEALTERASCRSGSAHDRGRRRELSYPRRIFR